MIETLAQAVHQVFCEEMTVKGYAYGPVTDDEKKQHNSLRPFAELPENKKEQNRDNARDIHRKLTSAGYTIIPAESNQVLAEFTQTEVEKLAREEHGRWMKKKLADGWQHAEKTDKANTLYKDIVPWEQLTEEEKDKDRMLVKAIPRILGKAGYVMVKSD
jgi:bifunctional DNA-binding transcriptional regulator/antitoxin component of YhaV-PrlF toxin-antitoxin module